MVKSTCCFQGTPAQFLVPTSESSQPPLTPDLGSPMPYSVLTSTHSYSHTYRHICMHTHIIIININKQIIIYMYSIPVGYNNKVMSPSQKFYDFESLKLDNSLKITFFARPIPLLIHILTIFYLFIQRGFRTIS